MRLRGRGSCEKLGICFVDVALANSFFTGRFYAVGHQEMFRVNDTAGWLFLGVWIVVGWLVYERK